MTVSHSSLRHPPPRLSMDEYVEFVETSLRDADPARVVRQKSLEERIKTQFRYIEEDEAGAGSTKQLD